MQMKITILTRHYFSNFNRKTTVHFIAREFAKRGYQVKFISVGRSILSTFNKPESKRIPKDINRKRFNEIEPGISTIVMDEWVHPISSQSGLVSKLTSPSLLRYGKKVPTIIKNEIVDSEIVLIECGYAVAYFDYLQSICTKAKFIYFATDPLSQVGLRPEFEKIEMDSIINFDLVRVASKMLGERFPSETKLTVIPQGLDKSVFDNAKKTPFSDGTKNFISIGDMSFDYDSVITMAKLQPDAMFHIFGADIPEEYPDNIKVYGEVDFATLVPYIKFSDVGIMAYKMNTDMAYLTKTSLKFLQYSYCGLPIVTPLGPDWERANVYQYQPNNSNSINTVIKKAMSAGKDTSYANDILDWRDCADVLITQLD